VGTALAVLSWPALAGFEANGVALGASERSVKKHFPSAYCKPLEWASRAAERRCDEARVPFAGTQARITFYLKKDAVEAFEVRFDTSEAQQLAAALKIRYGKPVSEGQETVERGNKAAREFYKVRWQKGGQRALLIAPLQKRRASLTVSRGDFEEEIYRVR
jgi:hypothetical protein